MESGDRIVEIGSNPASVSIDDPGSGVPANQPQTCEIMAARGSKPRGRLHGMAGGLVFRWAFEAKSNAPFWRKSRLSAVMESVSTRQKLQPQKGLSDSVYLP